MLHPYAYTSRLIVCYLSRIGGFDTDFETVDAAVVVAEDDSDR